MNNFKLGDILEVSIGDIFFDKDTEKYFIQIDLDNCNETNVYNLLIQQGDILAVKKVNSSEIIGKSILISTLMFQPFICMEEVLYTC